MPKDTRIVLSVLLLTCAVGGGCDLINSANLTDADEPEPTPLYIAGTIAEHAVLIDGGDVAVQGYGLVVGLGTDGSSDVPPFVHKYLVKTMKQERLHSWREGTESLVPRRILEDKDTAAVLMGGAIPAGAPRGTRFDVFVSALRQTGTRSLAGGVLMPADMHLSLRGRAVPGGPTKAWARTGGSILVNPFVDPADSSQAAKLREGRIIGGGQVTRSRPVRLQLLRPDYARSQLIQRRINERFPGSERVATAKHRAIVELVISPKYKKDYRRFLRLVMHLPLRTGSGDEEKRAMSIVKAIQAKDAEHDELALVWEAMGRETVPIFSRLYLSESPEAAFYSARTGLRLGDSKAADVLIKFARTDGSHLQIPAIRELGEHGLPRAVIALRKLVNHSNELVRVAACESLLKLGDGATVTRVAVADRFVIDLVETDAAKVIYVAQTGKPRIVLFGGDMSVKSPVFFHMPDDLVTINAREGDEQMVIFRKVPRTGRMTPGLRVDFRVSSLLKLMGSPPVRGLDGKIRGLNLTYGQIVGIVYRMCKNKNIPAKFVLQPLPDVQRIYRDSRSSEVAEAPG